MSRSNNTDISSPVTRSFEWSGSEGKIKYYDKDKGEKGENVLISLPFSFLVLDRLAVITGFCEPDNSGYWSNEVRNTKTDKLVVRTKKGIVKEGIYKDIIGSLKGAQYGQSLYIGYYDENKELKIGKLVLSGSAIGSWIEFCKGKDIYKIAIKIDEAIPKKKGATNYFEPVYKAIEIKEETNNAAIELDKIVQVYLDSYFKRGAQPVEQHQPETTVDNTQTGRQAQNNASNSFQQPSNRPEPIYTGADEITEPVDDLPF